MKNSYLQKITQCERTYWHVAPQKSMIPDAMVM